MTDSKNGGLDKTTGNTAQEEANIYEDEINLIDYFLILWKHKFSILLCSVLPALVAGLTLFFGPRNYEISYTYNVGVFKALEDKFYSTENMEKLTKELQANDLNDYAQEITGIRTAEGLKEFISFDFPSSSNPDKLENLQEDKEALLVMHVTAKPEDCVRRIALVCRENFEQIIPLYAVREELNSKIISLKEEMADTEEAGYTLNLQLERKKDTLEKLKNSGSEGLDKLPSDIVLQFNDVKGNSAFLPLLYQIQAAKTRIIDLEEQIRTNKETYGYYTDLLKLNGTLLSHVEESMPSYYTLGQFHVFLADMLAGYSEDEQPLRDYLKAYIKRVENKIATVVPLIEKPTVYSAAKGTVKKSGVVFAVALMLSMFAAFFFEGLRKSQAQAF